jgi:hypothetical protein
MKPKGAANPMSLFAPKGATTNPISATKPNNLLATHV